MLKNLIKKCSFMMIPVIIGVLFSNLVLNNFLPSASLAKDDFLSSFEKGEVLGVFENANHLPLAAYNHLNPGNYLPKNEDKEFIPVRKNDKELFVFASSSLIIDSKTDTILWERGINDKRSIASISKLMSALVFLDSVPNWDAVYKMKKSDYRNGGKSYIYEGDELKISDLFNLALVASDNTAVIALISSLGLSEDEFVIKMNLKAKELGLNDTYFKDATGLNFENISTVKDISTLVKKALIRKNIKEVSSRNKYEFKTLGGRKVVAEATNMLLTNFSQDNFKIVGGKTGHTVEAGYCFVGEFSNKDGYRIIVVVLGASTDYARFREAKKMADWIFDNFEWEIAN